MRRVEGMKEPSPPASPGVFVFLIFLQDSDRMSLLSNHYFEVRETTAGEIGPYIRVGVI